MKLTFVFPHLFTVMQTFFELRTMNPADSQEFVGARQECILNTMSPSDSFCIIPARLNNTKTLVNALVSQEDYEKLTTISEIWYVSSSGYVVSSKRENGKYKRTYMHRVIMGTTARHINGDRLDNRRNNLVNISRKRPIDKINKDFKLHTVFPAEMLSTDCIPKDGENVIIHYKNEEKIYSGEIRNFLPHGFGMLTETQKSCLGWWIQGIFEKGIIMEHKHLPPRIATLTPWQIGPVKRALMWQNNKI